LIGLVVFLHASHKRVWRQTDIIIA